MKPQQLRGLGCSLVFASFDFPHPPRQDVQQEDGTGVFERLFRGMDADGDSEVTWDEFIRFTRRSRAAAEKAKAPAETPAAAPPSPTADAHGSRRHRRHQRRVEDRHRREQEEEEARLQALDPQTVARSKTIEALFTDDARRTWLRCAPLRPGRLTVAF